jgi:chromo domain-containing protein 1
MFEGNPRGSSEAVSPGGDGDDDNISLTSTVSGHDPDEEFEVESILAEQQIPDGTTYYLVEWAGFQLHESTWEPEWNLGNDLKAIWEQEKAKHATGELEPFNLQKFFDAKEKAAEEKADRHRRRNIKRKRLGLPLTPPFPDGDPSSDEAVEENIIEVSDSERARAPRSEARNQQRQRIFRGVPRSNSGASSESGTALAGSETKRPTDAGGQETATKASSSAKHKHIEPPQQTIGYQGTARRPSNAQTSAAPKSNTKLLTPIQTPVPSTEQLRPVARKTHTAKRSTKPPAGNIFTSGKKPKARPKLKDVASDPTRDPKLFDKFRYRRLVEVGSRNTEDMAPDISKMQLFDITKGPIAGRRSSGSSLQSPTTLMPQDDTRTPIEPTQPPTILRLAPVSASPDTAPPKKKRKSVRFNFSVADDEAHPPLVQEPEQMDVDSSIVHVESPQTLLPRPAETLAGSDQTRCKLPIRGSQSSAKKLILGHSSVDVTFKGLQESSSQHSWLTEFMTTATLEFRHTCFAKAAAPQAKALIQEPLASGIIESEGDKPAIERIAEYLRASLLALYDGQASYNVLVYPINCEEWNLVLSTLSFQEPMSPSEAALGFFIFASPHDYRLSLAPLTLPSEPQRALDDSETKPDNQHVASEREVVMKRLFGFDYTKLLPARPKPLPVHNFFLAIPISRMAIVQALYHWLRASNPECQISTSHQPGGWEAFRTRVESIPGVVIIHEMLAWSLRRIPRLSRYLIGRNDEYWCISEPVHGVPIYPSISMPECPEPPGEMRLIRLFPYRTAIFLTPSFLVSEPRRSLEFFNWFKSKWSSNFHFRLVTAHDIHEYLHELADERDQARQELWSHPGDVQPEIQANLSALSAEDCNCRYAVAELADDMHFSRRAKAGVYAHDEDSSSLVYADSSIDPNDEQSLVNWFGWWATLHADQFRKFHVMGSNQTIKQYGSRRGERRVRIPKYTKVTLNDPDAVLEVLHEVGNQVEAEGEATLQSAGNEEKQIGFNRGPWAFRSDLLPKESHQVFTAYLDELCTGDGFRSQWMLYKIPVSWLDLTMADHFGDINSKFWSRIQDWFAFTLPFGSKEFMPIKPRFGYPPRGYNTYIGFFYTIAEEWDPDNPPEKKHPQRHPWIAVYRPVNPHKRPFTRCEVIIWDPAVRERYPGKRTVAEKDLIFMQREVIQHVREGTGIKNEGTWLDQVWLGGWDWPEDCNSKHPIDVTLLFLRKMVSEIRDILPAPQHVMESKGYRRVTLGPTASFANQISRSPAAASDAGSSLFVDQDDTGHVPMDLDDPNPGAEEPEDENTRVIFHPPPGNKANRSSTAAAIPYRSRCVNRLYEEARLARARADPALPPPTHMTYRYVPTMDWYREQRAEGRGYNHINVDTWENVFTALKIGDGGGSSASSEKHSQHGAPGGSGSQSRRRAPNGSD